MRKVSFVRCLIVVFLINLISNMIHPVTPTLIVERGLPDYMFGVMFAAMALGSFLCSPLWGRFSDRHGRVRTLVLCGLGYTVCQFFFCYASTVPQMILVRFLGGAACCGQNVGCMAYIADVTDERSRPRHLAYFAAVTSVASSLGYFLGGIIGDISVLATFWTHLVLLAGSTGFTALILGESLRAPMPQTQEPARRFMLYDFRGMARMMTLPVAVFFLSVILSAFGTFGFDNAFSFYIKNEMGYPPSVNGIVKAVSGLLGLFANLCINTWIARRFQPYRALSATLGCCATLLFMVVYVQQVPLFFAINILFYLFNAMYLPMQQSLAMERQEGDYGLLSGMFFSAKYIGMVLGSLFAGFIYTAGAKLPFGFAALGFALAGLLTMGSYWFAKLPRKTRAMEHVHDHT